MSTKNWSKHQIFFMLILLSENAVFVVSQINLFARKDVMEGAIFPPELDVLVGEEIYLRIIQPVPNQTRCVYRSPNGIDIDAIQATTKISSWTSVGCGIRIKNASLNDTGHWRLTSYGTTATDMVRGITIVRVQVSNNTDSTTTLFSTKTDITPERTKYCYVLRPEQDRTEFPMHNECHIPQIDRELEANGVWHVVSGIVGQTEELMFEINVDAKVEQLQTSVENLESPTRTVLKCNLINTDKTITFCRFLRLTDNMGLNMEEGQGNIKYSYTGDGFHHAHCGMTIEHPDPIDQTVWKCYMGFNESKTIGAILDASEIRESLNDIQADEVYGLNGTDVNILCKSKIAIDYCWFTHPNGRRISVSESNRFLDSDLYRYFGSGLKLGECGLIIRTAIIADSGAWRCHLGRIDESGPEVTTEIAVRISESHLVASSLHKDVITEAALLIECITIPVHLPIEYCRFVLPNGMGFTINEKVTSDNPLMDNYYFNPNRERKFGYCSIIVQYAKSDEHTGNWTCAGKLIGRDEENWDDFTVNVLSNGLSAASVAGMVVGSVVVIGIVVYIGIRSYRKKRIQRIRDIDLSETTSTST